MYHTAAALVALFLVILFIPSASSWTSRPSTSATRIPESRFIAWAPALFHDRRISSLTVSGPSICWDGSSSPSRRLSPLGGVSQSEDSGVRGTVATVDDGNGRHDDEAVLLKTPFTVHGPDLDTKPDYENIHGPLGKAVDRIFLTVFRTQLARHVGVDSSLPKDDFKGLIELTAALNARYSDRRQVQLIAQDTLFSLFPSWLPGQYAILFSKPFPQFSARMNAWATRVGGTWLMGECEVNDVTLDDGTVYKNQGLLVKRCRFLEESGCASVCVNSCKIPTQQFFLEDMGLPLTMTPDYETHECQFSFGMLPSQQGELDARSTPCLSRCPTSGSMRQWHDGGMGVRSPSSSGSATGKGTDDNKPMASCAFMDNGQCESVLGAQTDVYSTS